MRSLGTQSEGVRSAPPQDSGGGRGSAGVGVRTINPIGSPPRGGRCARQARTAPEPPMDPGPRGAARSAASQQHTIVFTKIEKSRKRTKKSRKIGSKADCQRQIQLGIIMGGQEWGSEHFVIPTG